MKNETYKIEKQVIHGIEVVKIIHLESSPKRKKEEVFTKDPNQIKDDSNQSTF